MLTIFLSILVLALLIGNAMLAFIKPANPAHSNESQLSVPEISVPESGRAFRERGPEHIDLNAMNTRVERVEQLLLKVNCSDFLGKKLDATGLGKKLRDFTDFRINAKIELEALKEDVAEVKKELGIKPKASPGEDFEISDKDLHSLVFRGESEKA